MAWFSADFHVHSCLSPCGDLASSPRVIAEMAREVDLDLMALTDHNSSLNCPAFAQHALRLGIGAMFGMEATAAEEAHVLCLFGDLKSAMDWSAFVYPLLADVKNDVDMFGDQVFVDGSDTILGEVDKYLVGALDLGLSDLALEVTRRGGVVIPAHVDRTAMSLMSQLGHVPPGPWSGLELLHVGTLQGALKMGKVGEPAGIGACQGTGEAMSEGMYDALMTALDVHGYMPGLAWQDQVLEGRDPFVPCFTASSDAHYPSDIGARRTLFWADKPDFDGLRDALARGWALGVWKRRV